MESVLKENLILNDMFESGLVHSPSGESLKLHSNISSAYADALYETVLRTKPEIAVEVGMAYGVSTLAILTALKKTGRGRLISIDPGQSTTWKNCGAEAVRKAELSALHQLIEEPNYVALPRLFTEKIRVDFGYVDGWHTFDYALIDFWYIDKMLNRGGIVGFNDCKWPAITKVIAFVLSHRKYEEIDVGLKKEYAGYSIRKELVRILRFSSRSRFYQRKEDRYFRKMEDWEPGFKFFAEF